jgi:hypothetical protein
MTTATSLITCVLGNFFEVDSFIALDLVTCNILYLSNHSRQSALVYKPLTQIVAFIEHEVDVNVLQDFGL